MVGECYIYFTQHLMSVFQETIVKFESSQTYSCCLHDLMVDIRDKIARRLSDSILEQRPPKVLRGLPTFSKNMLEKETAYAYQRALTYLEKWYAY